MLKNYGIIKQIGAQVSAAAEDAARSVLSDYSIINGREEEITAQLRGEINRHLVQNIENRLGNKDIKGCRFSVATFKKKQEKSVGADIAGVVELSVANRKISKAFLAQAKIGNYYVGPRDVNYIKSYNKDTLRQAEEMLKTTSDSFFFLYSNLGVHCVSALQVVLSGSKTIDTGQHPFHTFGSFYEEFFKCFIGDHLISPAALGAKNLEDYAEKVNAATVMKLSVQLKPGD